MGKPKGGAATPAREPVSTKVMALVEPILDDFLSSPPTAEAEMLRVRKVLGADVADLANSVMAISQLSYPAALIVQVGSGLVGGLGSAGHTERGEGGRPTAKSLGTALKLRHIAAVNDAFENVGKNTAVLARGVQPLFDDSLRWLDGATDGDRREFLRYILAKISLTARAVLPQPTLDRAELTFHACAVFVDALLKIPSGGAYQQFACAAFLHALLDEFGQIGTGALRVDTKNLNATDTSSKVIGDIQIMRSNRLEEAFEVTANPWRSKVAPALAAGKLGDLPRIHIIADVESTFPASSDELAADPGVDLTVIDVQSYLRTLIALMRKPARDAAFVRLYQLLDRHQADVEKTNAYVRLLRSHGLATP